ncbi:MAG: OmpA family protein [Alphaproteobacteria bacterium]|nr:OmpA family protein [Alphaproteobacteria bacterium]
MTVSSFVPRALAVVLAAGAVVGCSQWTGQSAAPSQNAANPELAGAWYEVFFDTNSADINDRGRVIVRSVAYVATNNPDARVTVIGKADRVGTQATNMTMSQRRAEAVRGALVAAGVPAQRIVMSWTGESNPPVATPDETTERRNRVVDVTVVKQMASNTN